MNVATTVPITMRPGVKQYVAELGFEAELEEILQHMRVNVPELVSVDVEKFTRYDEDGPDGVSITATTSRLWEEVIEIENPIGEWKLTEFPPEVFTVFVVGVRSNRS